ncbi:MAG: hypothetical protein ACP5T3_01125 [Candidatus Micrarchaeia archaeon]
MLELLYALLKSVFAVSSIAVGAFFLATSAKAVLRGVFGFGSAMLVLAFFACSLLFYAFAVV